jgi:allantoinase
MCEQPANLIGNDKKGRITIGADADLMVWDPNKAVVPTAKDIIYKHKVTPFEGEDLTGEIIQTYLKGTRVFNQGDFVSLPIGDVLLNN